jgi:hypothetical protein
VSAPADTTASGVPALAPNDRVEESIRKAARRLPARRMLTQRAAARWQRRTVTRLLDEFISFENVGSLTERARWRDEILATLDGSRRECVQQARSHARERGRGGWS